MYLWTIELVWSVWRDVWGVKRRQGRDDDVAVANTCKYEYRQAHSDIDRDGDE